MQSARLIQDFIEGRIKAQGGTLLKVGQGSAGQDTEFTAQEQNSAAYRDCQKFIGELHQLGSVAGDYYSITHNNLTITVPEEIKKAAVKDTKHYQRFTQEWIEWGRQRDAARDGDAYKRLAATHFKFKEFKERADRIGTGDPFAREGLLSSAASGLLRHWYISVPVVVGYIAVCGTALAAGLYYGGALPLEPSIWISALIVLSPLLIPLVLGVGFQVCVEPSQRQASLDTMTQGFATLKEDVAAYVTEQAMLGNNIQHNGTSVDLSSVTDRVTIRDTLQAISQQAGNAAIALLPAPPASIKTARDGDNNVFPERVLTNIGLEFKREVEANIRKAIGQSLLGVENMPAVAQ